MRYLDKLEETIIATLIAAATLLIFIAVVHRYGCSNAVLLSQWAKANGYDAVSSAARSVFFALNSIRLTWAQELCIFMFVWMAKFGAAYGVRTGIHVGVDIVLNNVSEARRRALIYFGLFAGALFTLVVGTLGAKFVWHIYQFGQVSAVLEAPMWIVYLAIPLGSFLMCFRFLEVAWTFSKTGELPHHDPGHVEGLDTPAEAKR